MIPLDARSSTCLELPQEEGTKLQIQASILDGYKGKMGSEDKACSAYLELMFPPFFLPFSVSSVERLIKADKNSYYALVTKSDLCNRSLEPLVRGPKYIFNRNIFTGRAVTRVDTQLEDLLQFAHDLYHLHVITP